MFFAPSDFQHLRGRRAHVLQHRQLVLARREAQADDRDAECVDDVLVDEAVVVLVGQALAIAGEVHRDRLMAADSLLVRLAETRRIEGEAGVRRHAHAVAAQESLGLCLPRQIAEAHERALTGTIGVAVVGTSVRSVRSPDAPESEKCVIRYLPSMPLEFARPPGSCVSPS